MRGVRKTTAALAFGVCLVLGSIPAAGSAQASWDQARVTAYAVELATAANELREAMLQEPAIVSLAQQRAYYEAREDVRLIRNAAAHLAGRLKEGKGREETYATFRRIDTLRRDAEENGRKAEFSDTTMDKVFAVGAALIKIGPYYRKEEGRGKGME